MTLSKVQAKRCLENTEILSGMTRNDFTKRAEDILFERLDDTDEATVDFWDEINKYDLEDVFGLLDADGDGTLSDDEISQVNSRDDDDDNLSLYDLEDVIKELDELQNAQNTPSASGSSSGSGASSVNSSNPTNNAPKTKTPEEYKAEIQAKEQEKVSIQQETQNAIAQCEQQMTQALQSPEIGISPEVLAQYNEQNATLDSQISAKTQEISTQQSALQTANATVAAQQDAISRYGSQIQSLQAAMSSEGADTADLSSKIANLEAAKSQAQTALSNAQAQVEQAQIQIETLEAEKKDLETQKDGLKTKLIEDNKNNPEVQRIVSEAQSKIKELQNSEQSKLSTLDSEIQTLKTELAKAEQEEQVSKTLSENSNMSINDPEGLYESMGLEAEGLNKDVFLMAIEGYNNLTDEQRKTGFLSVVDTSRGQNNAVCYVLNLNDFKLDKKLDVNLSANSMDNVAYANQVGSKTTASGFVQVGDDYWSKKGRWSVRWEGLEQGVNDNAMERSTVIHQSNGRTWGCLGLPGKWSNDDIYSVFRRDSIIFFAPTDETEYRELSSLV